MYVFLVLLYIASTLATTVYVNPGDNIQTILDELANPQQSHRDTSTSTSKVCILRTGIHYLNKPLILTTHHSNITLRGEEGAIIDGGIILPPFQSSSPYPKLWETTIPSSFVNPVSLPTQLYINGQRRIRGRSPNILDTSISGQYTDPATYHMADVLSPCTAPVWGTCPDSDKLGFIYNSSDIHGIPNPAWNLNNAWILYFQSWTAEWIPFGNLYPANNTIMFSTPAQGTIGQFGYLPNSPSGGRWILENSLDLVDSPGEYYITNDTGILYYYPYPNETTTNVTAVVPATSTLLNITGVSIYNPIENMIIENIQFQNFGEISSTARLGFHYANSAAIQISYAVNTQIQNCTITAGMTNGILLEAGIINLLLDHNNIVDVGGNGISGMLQDGAPNNATNIIISNNTISQTGFIYMGQPASISISGKNATITHNEVSNVPYGAIQIGWQSGTNGPPVPPLPPYDFIVSYNYIHDYGLGVLSDFGGIYTSAWAGDDCWVNPDPNTRGCWTPIEVHHNFVTRGSHYIGGYGSNGGYMDEGIDGVVWHHNIMSTTGATSLYFHCGYNNTAYNNIFFNAQVQETSMHAGMIGGCNTGGYTPADGSLVIFHTNIIFATNTPSMMDGSGDNYYWLGHDQWISDYNVWYGINNGKPPLNFPNNTIDLDQWQTLSGNDQHSVEQDPLLVDPFHNNFTVLSTSPVWNLGWTIIDLSSIGPVGN